MKNEKHVHVGYRSSEDSMKRVITIPVGFSIIMLEGRRYDYAMLKESRQITSFGKSSEIIQDVYGQHWYHRMTRVKDMEPFDTYEPLPEYIVSDEYEKYRIPDMMIYPYIRVDHARKLLEVYENYASWKDERAFKEWILELNEKNMENL